MRKEVDDRLEQVDAFREAFADPHSLPEREEKRKRGVGVEDLGLDLNHLHFAQRVVLPGMTPFLGVPRLSRLGQVYYDCVDRDEVERLKDRLLGEVGFHPLVEVQLKDNPFVKMKLLIAMLNEISPGGARSRHVEKEDVPPDAKHYDNVMVDDVDCNDSDEEIAELMGWERELLYEPPRLLQKMYWEKEQSVVEKRKCLIKRPKY